MHKNVNYLILLNCIGEGNGTPLQYSCLENPIDGGAWQATVRRVSRVRHNLVTTPAPPPDGPVDKTPCFHCMEHRFNPCLGNQDPPCHTVRPKKKNSDKFCMIPLI